MRNPFEISGNRNSRRYTGILEWEESAVDNHSDVEGFLDEHRSRPALAWLRIVIVVACLILAGQLFHLQVLQGKSYGALAQGNRLRAQTILAPRGMAYDRYGEVLVQNTASFSLTAVPVDLPKEGLDDEVSKLIALLHLDPAEVQAQVQKFNRTSLEPALLKMDISPDDRILFETHASDFPGFSIHTVPIRHYPQAEIFSHLLGYAGVISEQELASHEAERYEPNDYIGKTGIELSYERYFRGTNGQEQMEVDAFGKPVKVLGTIDPVAGNRVDLNIDKGLQEELYRSFQDRSGSPRGAAIALDPRNGNVLALLSMPGYDNNLFARGISTVNYQKFTNDKNLPLFNRAIAGTYPPGSVIKIAGAAAALQEQVVNEHTVINDRGVLVIPNQYNPGISYNFYGWKHSGLGPMTVGSAIAQSSDIFFYTVAGGYPTYPNINPLGADKLAEYYRKFGMGQLTGIDLQGEKPGVVADPAWKEEYYKDTNDPVQTKWYLGDTYHIAIGQGDMLVTPLQVAEWTSVIANGGVGYKPTILRRVVDSAGKTIFEPEPEILIKKFANDKNIHIVQEGMEETVRSGSGVSLASLPVCSAGKTGTSQFDGANPALTHAWFTVYAPCGDPQIVITVLAEAGGEGHSVAVPIAKDALSWWIKNRYGAH